MKKIIWTVVIIVIALIAVFAFVGLFYLGPIVKLGIQQVGPQVTKVSVNVDAVDVSLLSGSASIKGLAVGNPQGFKSPQAISVGNMSVSLDPLSVTSSKILIHSVRVDSPEITFEAGLGGSNLSKILSNLTSSASNPSAPGNNTSASSGASKPAPKIEIDDFMITGAKVNVSISGVASKVVPLPDIHLTDLGKGSDGLTPVELTKDILSALLSATVKAVAGSVGGISQTVGSFANSLGNLFGKK